MRVTIIPADKVVIVDGEARSPLEFELDQTIHAVQWYGAEGEVEFISDFGGGKPSNQKITDLSAFQSALDAWTNWTPPEPPPQPEPLPPQVVSMRQARLALLAADLLDDVEAAISSANRAVQIEWEYATVVERSSPLVFAIGGSLGLTESTIDDLFLDASKR